MAMIQKFHNRELVINFEMFILVQPKFQSVSFRKTSRNLQRSMWWKNVKLMVILAVVVIVSPPICFFYSFFVLLRWYGGRNSTGAEEAS